MHFYSKESSRIEDNYRMYSHLGYEGICAFCGESFKSSSPKAKYCSQRCQNDAYMKRRKERKELEKQKVCAMCKKQLRQRKRMQCIVVMLVSKRHIEKRKMLLI